MLRLRLRRHQEDEENKQFELSGKTFHEGDWLSIDGSTGKIYDGAIPTVDASIGG